MFNYHHAFFRPLVLVTALFSANSFAAEVSVMSKPVDKGLYELVYSQPDNALFVASAQGRDDQGGVVYRLDPQSLQSVRTLKNTHKPFGIALDQQNNRLFLGNSREGAVTLVDANNGAELKHLVLDGRKRTETLRPLQVREIVFDAATDRLYIPGVGADSVVWVVDAKNLTLLDTIKNTGKIATGVALDSKNHTLYITNSDGELLMINTGNNRIEKRVRLVESGDSALLNIALDKTGNRLFITDFKQAGVRVADTATGKVIHTIAVPESLAVLFNPARDELYVTHRKEGTVSIIDTKDYSVKQTLKAPGLPNSLALSADGNTLFVSVKQPATRDKPATSADEVMRISL